MPTWRRMLLAAAAVLVHTDASAQCPAIPLLRYDIDPAMLHTAACESWNRLAYVPLDPSNGRYLAFGGEIRQRYAHTGNPEFGAETEDPQKTWLQRFAAHADAHLSERWRVFAELHSALEDGRATEPSATDENELEWQNVFVEVRTRGESEWRVRAGRQELQLGSARLVSVRDGPNVRRTFDGLRLLARAGAWSIDVLAVRPRRDERGALDDTTDDSQSLWGAYATLDRGNAGARGIDVYYLGHRNDDAVYGQGAAAERRHTIGARFFGADGRWDWDVEPMVQLGDFGDADLLAWTVASETGYSWAGLAWQPRLALSANIASGDRDPLDPGLETFSPLYPRGNYFSEDATLWPQNFYNAHLFLTVQPASRWTLTADYNMFWRMSADDAVYGSGGTVLRPDSGNDERFVATGLSLAADWSVKRHVSVSVIATHFSPRTFLEQTGAAASLRFFELTVRLRI